MRLQFPLASLSLVLFAFAAPTDSDSESHNGGDVSTTHHVFTLTARNSSYPDLDGKELWIHYSGFVYLDAGVANPPSSFKLFAFLNSTQLRRVRQTGSGLGSAPGTEGNLNFGTSNVCCDYARLNFSTPADLPDLPSHAIQFYLTGSDRHLVYGEDTLYRRSPWYACTPNGGGPLKAVYYNKPFYDYPDHGDSECTVVALVSKTVKKDLPPLDPTPAPPK